jgi:F-type H+-transporting ATPase subunit gamma
MSNTLGIRRRIRSVGNVKQITKAMELTAAAKMHRSSSAVLGARPYAIRALSLVRSLEKRGISNHPLLEVRPIKNELLIAFFTDRGMVGSINAQLARSVSQYISQSKNNLDVVIVGKKGAKFVNKSKANVIATYTDIPSKLTFEYTRPISLNARMSFENKEYDLVNVAYNHFASTLTQKPTITQVLPFTDHPDSIITNIDTSADEKVLLEAIIEPDIQTLFNSVLPRLVDQVIFETMLEAQASEYAASMVAMRNATDNAEDLLSDLQLSYNSIRQSSITAEMAEISASIAAMED